MGFKVPILGLEKGEIKENSTVTFRIPPVRLEGRDYTTFRLVISSTRDEIGAFAGKLISPKLALQTPITGIFSATSEKGWLDFD